MLFSKYIPVTYTTVRLKQRNTDTLASRSNEAYKTGRSMISNSARVIAVSVGTSISSFIFLRKHRPGTYPAGSANV